MGFSWTHGVRFGLDRIVVDFRWLTTYLTTGCTSEVRIPFRAICARLGVNRAIKRKIFRFF